MKKSLGLIAGLFLSVFFVGIMLFVLLEVLHITDQPAGDRILIFSCINFAIVIGVFGCGKLLAQKLGVGMYAPLCLVTVLYTIVQFSHMGFNFKADTTAGYTLFHLILLFVYFAVTIPLCVVGINSKNDK